MTRDRATATSTIAPGITPRINLQPHPPTSPPPPLPKLAIPHPRRLSTTQLEGSPVQSIFIYKLSPKDTNTVEWAANLQDDVATPQTFFVTSAAVHPTQGNLIITGTYAGNLTLGGESMNSEGSFDAFVASSEWLGCSHVLGGANPLQMWM
jgi:hypothetical protein